MKCAMIQKKGFTLVETVIAIGVLAVLLTAFMFVFAPASDGIKKAIGVEEANRLATGFEVELATLRQAGNGNVTTGFDQAFNRIKNSNQEASALLLYQYRGDPNQMRADGTPEPVVAQNKLAGKDYKMQMVVRTKADMAEFTKDLPAIDGRVYFVKCRQLIFKDSKMQMGDVGKIVLQEPGKADVVVDTPDAYLSAALVFNADFYVVKNRSASYFTKGFSDAFTRAKKPIFSRNLSVRR